MKLQTGSELGNIFVTNVGKSIGGIIKNNFEIMNEAAKNMGRSIKSNLGLCAAD